MELIKDLIAVIKNRHRLVIVADEQEAIDLIVKVLDKEMKKSKRYAKG